MRRRWRRRWWTTLAAASLGSLAVQAQPAPPVADLLHAADAYLVRYSHAVAAIAADETYAQYDTSAEKMRARRRLTGTFVLFGLGNGSIAGFRDVTAIDDAPLDARDERLSAIFVQADPSSPLDEARRLTDDSVKHYLTPNLHALDQPTIALEFLRKSNQERSTFKIESIKRIADGQIAVLKFTEHGTPRLVPMPGGGAAVGRFWIDAASGTVRQTELGLSGKGVSVRVTVKYAQQPSLKLWLPVEMSQQVDTHGPGVSNFSNMGGGPDYRMREAHEGRASYSNFRRIAGAARRSGSSAAP